VRTALVVDDSPDTCHLLLKLLQMMGCPATHADNGQAALAQVRAARPALVILDVMMPDMSGLEVLREIRADPSMREVAVIMHSARDDEVTRRLATRDGAQGYFVKTKLGYAELRALVDTYVASEPGPATGAI
jgi:two-component system phosphate regulon response regulator PhoB